MHKTSIGTIGDGKSIKLSECLSSIIISINFKSDYYGM